MINKLLSSLSRYDANVLHKFLKGMTHICVLHDTAYDLFIEEEGKHVTITPYIESPDMVYVDGIPEVILSDKFNCTMPFLLLSEGNLVDIENPALLQGSYKISDLTVPEFSPITISDLNGLPVVSSSTKLSDVESCMTYYTGYGSEEFSYSKAFEELLPSIFRLDLITEYDSGNSGKYNQSLYRVFYQNEQIAYIVEDGKWSDDQDIYITNAKMFSEFTEFVTNALRLDKDAVKEYSKSDTADFLLPQLEMLLCEEMEK